MSPACEFTLRFQRGATFAAVDDLSTYVEGTDSVNVRVAVMAVPFVAMLAAASAGASTVSLLPLGPAQPRQVATIGATCAVPYASAHLAAPFMQYPTLAKMMGSQGVAIVGVSLSPAGRVVRAWRIQSTGNPLLDLAALDAAQNSEYVAERAQCNSVGGEYKVEVDFSLDQ